MLKKLKKIIKKGKILINEPLKNHTTFHIGGNASFLVMPNDFLELKNLIEFLKNNNIQYYVLGNGSNVLASDDGFNGVVIKLTKLNEIRLYEDCLQVFCGANLNSVCLFLKQHNLGGFEDAFGIPGTVGGAVVMNASAYNFEISKVVKGVLILKDNKFDYLNNEQCGFGYRKSNFENAIVLSVDFKIFNGCESERMDYVFNMRKTFQPLNFPSAGSVFKRVNGVVVSKLLDQMGFKGKKCGGAMVSEKHAGFIVNVGDATATDVKNLIISIKNEVKDKQGIELEEEIKFL